MKRNNWRKLTVFALILSLLLVATGCQKKPNEDPTRGFGFTNSYQSSNWTVGNNTKQVNTNVASGSRAKYTKIKGNGQDVYTIMVYMCGADLESRASMGTYDLTEMAKAKLSDKVNLLVYTGGCTKWHLGNGKVISTQVNQIYRFLDGGNAERVVDNAGNGTMVSSNTLQSFIDYCVDNYEADRYGLIFWDHGSGSVGGYGYDEKYPSNAPMSYAKIDEALTNSGIKFDFVGFDACLMATLENGLMLAPHADYMIASEEVEPGIGWYYTNWLTKLAANTSMPTLEIGKNIIDDFVAKTAQDVPQQVATLSIIDLAELSYTVPSRLTAFAQSANQLITNSEYRTVATARKNCREFGTSQGVDLVDFVDLATKMNTKEAKELTNALLSAVKYNNVSASMSNSYGVSIYFPYRSNKYINNVLKNYDDINMDSEYSSVIRNFASYQVGGQVSSGGNTNPFASLLGTYTNNSYSQQGSADLIGSLLGSFLQGTLAPSQPQQTSNPYAGLYELGLNLLFGRGMEIEPLAEYISKNHFDADLNWKDGKITLTNEQWALVDDLQLNVFVDDGTGYIDLGCDDTYELEGNSLLQKGGETWLALSCDETNWTVIPYYYISSTYNEDGSDYTIYGRVPVLLNDEKADLILVFTDENPKGVVAGATYSYDNAIVSKNLAGYGFKDETVMKAEEGTNPSEGDLVKVEVGEDTYLNALVEGDVLKFVCDYYNYDGTFNDSYILNQPLTVTGQLHIGDISIANYKVLATYQFTDMYHQTYWTTPVKK